MNEQPIRVLDLFSGIGGFALAAEIANALADAQQRQDHGERGVDIRGRTHQAAQRDNRKAGSDSLDGCCEDVDDAMPTGSSSERRSGGEQSRSWKHRFAPLAHAEVEPFACAVYHKHFPDSVCVGGVENVSRDSLLERCGVLPDVVCGGFPCQPHSCAGKRLASADERDLWGECRRILGDVRPRFALFENVSGLLTSESGLFFNRVLSDLAALRYACQWQVVPAAAVGAPHRRDRIWMLCWAELADADQAGRRELRGAESTGAQQRSAERGGLAWPALSGHWPSRPGEPQHGWEPPRTVESALGASFDGLPASMGGTGPEVHNRVAQLKAAGNAIVPEVAAIFMLSILRMYQTEGKEGAR